MIAPKARTRSALLALSALALAARGVAAVGVERVARRRGELCLFDDTNIYWSLAGAIRAGAPYEVDQSGIPHLALRTPGYPLFLAACRALFGDGNTLAPRLVQAALGAACVPLVYAIVRRIWPERPRSVALIAAGLAALEPYWAASAALLLSEAAFVPLMLGMLWGLATLWDGRRPWVALATGMAGGAGILVKPSWALAVPALLAAAILARRSAESARMAAIAILGVVLVMAPWWARNARALGTFVPTALWAGASLYDGLNPGADGSSDMAFLNRPPFVSMGETEQDHALRDAALAFARANPGRVARLAVVKAGRFWNPWPNAADFRSSPVNLASAAVTLPMFLLLARGTWRSRRDVRALVLLGGPLLYFFALHLVFVSSIRYRIPAMVPAFGLVAAGWGKGEARVESRESRAAGA